ncbi:hypothetical protein D1872_310560 [compost metagenome]
MLLGENAGRTDDRHEGEHLPCPVLIEQPCRELVSGQHTSLIRTHGFEQIDDEQHHGREYGIRNKKAALFVQL